MPQNLSFIVKSFHYIGLIPENPTHIGRGNICAVLAHSRQQFNSSSIPAILMDEDLWLKLSASRIGTQGLEEPHYHKFLNIFLLSDTLQWSQRFYCYNGSMFLVDFLTKFFHHLINEKRYFCSSIKHLKLPAGKKLLKQIADSPARLESLDLADSLLLRDEDLADCISKMTSLRSLNLDSCDLISDSGFKSLSTLKDLRSLSVVWASMLSGRSVLMTCEFFPLLEHLEMSIPFTCSKHFECLAKSLKRLRTLYLEQCAEIDDDCATEISKMTLLRRLTLPYCEISDDVKKRLQDESTVELEINNDGN